MTPSVDDRHPLWPSAALPALVVAGTGSLMVPVEPYGFAYLLGD